MKLHTVEELTEILKVYGCLQAYRKLDIENRKILVDFCDLSLTTINSYLDANSTHDIVNVNVAQYLLRSIQIAEQISLISL